MKKIISGLLSLTIMGSMCLNSSAFYEPLLYEEKLLPDEDEIVCFIVEVDGDAVLETKAAKSVGTEFLSTYDGQVAERKLQSKQQQVFNSIESSADKDIVMGHTYTVLFNGFSLEAPRSMLDEIKNTPGVKNVYESRNMELHLSSANEMTSSTPQDTVNIGLDNDGYTGKGQAVAILDSEFQLDHEFFKKELDTVAITEEEANSVKANAYRNTKIPFAYDYADGDYETSCPTNAHGTHVAGIAAGVNIDKFLTNVTTQEGETLPTSISGVAPDAQLVLMKVGEDTGKLSEDAVLEAMDDAVTLNVCAINMSFGTSYASPLVYGPYEQAIDNAVSNGITVNASAGNDGISCKYYGAYADMADYGTVGTPASHTNVTTVASVDNTHYVDNSNVYKPYETAGQISVYSSWGVNESLELKPEISAPGGMILSSYPSEEQGKSEYVYNSGTSMSAPHMTGVTALMNEYLNTNGIKLEYLEKVQRIENMLMSAADIIYQPDGVPTSPRAQGAGLVNVKNAMKTPVIIIGDNGKTKLSLKEITETFDLEFTLKNLTDTAVTYDTVTINVIADKATDGMVTGVSRELKFTCDTEPVTVPASGTATFKRTVKLDSNELNENMSVFTNGFFVDGFVSFQNNEDPQISIPFTGFYGDWEASPIFDKTIYDEGGSRFCVFDKENNREFIIRSYVYTSVNGTQSAIGVNYDKKTINKDRISISPNGDGMADTIGMHLSFLRTASNLSATLVKNGDNKKGIAINYRGTYNKYVYGSIDVIESDSAVTTNLPDGNYTLTITGTYPNSTNTDIIELPVTVDRQMPDITDIDVNGREVTISVMDRNFVNHIGMTYTDAEGTKNDDRDIDQSEKGQVMSETFTIPDDVDLDTVYFYARDNAYNTVSIKMSNIGKIAGYLYRYIGYEDITTTQIKFINTTDTDISGNVYAAYYDNTGRMVGISKADNITFDVDTDTNKQIPFTSSDNTLSATEIRLFIWDNNIMPLDTKKVFKINN